MYEKGFRHLSPKASEKWTELQLLWQENRKKGPLPRGIEKKFLQVQQQENLSLLNLHVQRAATLSIGVTQL